MKFHICQPQLSICENKGNVRLCSDVICDKKKWKLFYEVPWEYREYLVTERADAFLLPILPMAMMYAQNLPNERVEITADVPLSKRLYHQLKHYYMPTVSNNISYYSPVELNLPTEDAVLISKSAVGTGISAGVDSSYTIAKYCGNREDKYQLTHGVHMDIGIYGGYDTESAVRLKNKAKKIAEDVGLKYLCLKTNTCLEIYGKAHAPIVPAIFMGAILSLQKLFGIYYYSSGFSAEESYFSEADAAYYDWLNTMAFSTQNTTFYSSGLETTRLGKIDYIKNYPFTYKNLCVCLSEDQHDGNCGRCAKCTRTMAELEALGVLDLYQDVFDVKAFRADMGYHWGYVLLKSWEGDSFSVDILKKYKESGRKLPMSVFFAAIKKWCDRGFTTRNRKREKVEDLFREIGSGV